MTKEWEFNPQDNPLPTHHVKRPGDSLATWMTRFIYIILMALFTLHNPLPISQLTRSMESASILLRSLFSQTSPVDMSAEEIMSSLSGSWKKT